MHFVMMLSILALAQPAIPTSDSGAGTALLGIAIGLGAAILAIIVTHSIWAHRRARGRLRDSDRQVPNLADSGRERR